MAFLVSVLLVALVDLSLGCSTDGPEDICYTIGQAKNIAIAKNGPLPKYASKFWNDKQDKADDVPDEKQDMAKAETVHAGSLDACKNKCEGEEWCQYVVYRADKLKCKLGSNVLGSGKLSLKSEGGAVFSEMQLWVGGDDMDIKSAGHELDLPDASGSHEDCQDTCTDMDLCYALRYTNDNKCKVRTKHSGKPTSHKELEVSAGGSSSLDWRVYFVKIQDANMKYEFPCTPLGDKAPADYTPTSKEQCLAECLANPRCRSANVTGGLCIRYRYSPLVSAHASKNCMVSGSPGDAIYHKVTAGTYVD